MDCLYEITFSRHYHGSGFSEESQYRLEAASEYDAVVRLGQRYNEDHEYTLKVIDIKLIGALPTETTEYVLQVQFADEHSQKWLDRLTYMEMEGAEKALREIRDRYQIEHPVRVIRRTTLEQVVA